MRELLRRCLSKDARSRLRDIGDARVELEEILADPTATVAIAPVSEVHRTAPTPCSPASRAHVRRGHAATSADLVLAIPVP